MRYFIVTPIHVAQDCNPGGHFITAGLKHLLLKADPEAMFWDVPMYAYSQRTWKLLGEFADVVVMSGHPRFSNSKTAHHWWDTDLWTRIESVIGRGKRFVDAWAGGSHNFPLKSIDEMGKTVRSQPWVKRILRVEKKSTICITRDALAQRVISPDAPHALKLPCNSWFAPQYFGVSPAEQRTLNLIIPSRAEGREGVCKKFNAKAAEMTKLNGLPTIPIVHSFQDWEWCRKHGLKDVQCIYEPRTLLRMYAACDMMLSMRIHASVPAMALGCRVLHVGSDARLLTVEEFGIKANRQGVKDDMAFEFKKASVIPDESAAIEALRFDA